MPRAILHQLFACSYCGDSVVGIFSVARVCSKRKALFAFYWYPQHVYVSTQHVCFQYP